MKTLDIQEEHTLERGVCCEFNELVRHTHTHTYAHTKY